MNRLFLRLRLKCSFFKPYETLTYHSKLLSSVNFVYIITKISDFFHNNLSVGLSFFLILISLICLMPCMRQHTRHFFIYFSTEKTLFLKHFYPCKIPFSTSFLRAFRTDVSEQPAFFAICAVVISVVVSRLFIRG